MRKFLDRLNRLASVFAAEPPLDYAAVVKLPSGEQYVRRPGVANQCLQEPDRPFDPPYRRFRPGIDDVDRWGQPLRVVVIEAQYLADPEIWLMPHGPANEIPRDDRYPPDDPDYGWHDHHGRYLVLED